MILPLFALQQMYQDPIRCNCRIKTSLQILGRNLRSSVMNMEKLSPKTMRTLAEPNLLKWTLIQGIAPPVSSRPYTLPLKHYEWVQREIESLECAGVITKSMSKWASPIVIVPKKSAPGEPPKRRLCVDFRKSTNYNRRSLLQERPRARFPSIYSRKFNEMYAKLKGAKVFSTIDLRSGYHHIAMGKCSRAKTAFVMPFGKYEFLMVPFGLAQAPAYFQLLMN